MEVDPPSYDDGRDERERSVRATAPPPSPTEKRAVMDAFRGYVERDEEIPGLEGHMGSDKEIENEFKLIPYQAVPVSVPSFERGQLPYDMLIVSRARSIKPLQGRRKRKIWRKQLPIR
jgi:hypothetical protein